MVNLFQQHSRHFQENRYVYPVVSRRSRGLSIGIDLTPQHCTFRCIYCSESDGLSKTRPTHSLPIDLDLLRRELTDMLTLSLSGELFRHLPFDKTPQTHRRLNDIALSGSGEPTLSPSFEAVCALIREESERFCDAGMNPWQAPKVVLITNATALHLPAVQRGIDTLEKYLEIWAKLDAGTLEHYALMNRSSVPFKKVLDNLLSMGLRRGISIQTFFGMLDGRPPSEHEIDAWLRRLSQLKAAGARIEGVQIYTLARAAPEPSLGPLPDATLQAIAGRVEALGLKAAWFGSTA